MNQQEFNRYGKFAIYARMGSLEEKTSQAHDAKADSARGYADHIKNEITTGLVRVPTYCVLSVTLNGKKAGKVSGNITRLSQWLAERDGEGQKPEWELLGFSTDRNWASSQASEV